MTTTMTTTDLDSQRALVSRYHSLLDTDNLLTAQRAEIARLFLRLAQRKAVILPTRRMRPEYISDDALGELARVLDLEAEERVLEERDRRLRDMQEEVRKEMVRFSWEKNRGGCSRLHYDPPPGYSLWSAREWGIVLAVLVALLCGLVWCFGVRE